MRISRFCHRNSIRCDDDPASIAYRYSSYGADTPLCCASHLTEILFFVTSLFEAHGIRYFICWGTHLGALRHRGIIPWDTDVDLGIFADDYERVLAQGQRFSERGFHVRSTPAKSLLTVNYSATNLLHLDIEIWRKEGSTFAWQNDSIAEHDMLPLRSYPFYDRHLTGPAGISYVLDYYGADCLEYGRKQWIGWGTRLFTRGLARPFGLIDRSPASIDLGRDYEAESSGGGMVMRGRASIARSLRLWKLRTYWAKLTG